MKNIKIYYKLLKMIFLKYYCADFMFLVVVLCGTYSSTIFSLVIFNFPIVFNYQSCLLKFMSSGLNYEIYS